jgi:hypothetical protein
MSIYQYIVIDTRTLFDNYIIYYLGKYHNKIYYKIIMVLSNSASRSRNMVQTNNQPQAADFGSIFPSVGVSAYGARNRRQRGVYNIKFWSSFRPKTTVGPNTGRRVTAVRGSAWNVIGTSAHSILIDNVTSASQSLSHATTAESVATTAKTTANAARINSDSPFDAFGKIAIHNINTARTAMIALLVSAASAADDADTNNDNRVASNKLNELNTLFTTSILQLDTDEFDLTSDSNLSINDINDYNARIQSGTTQVSTFLEKLEGTLAIPTEVETANASTSTAITVDANYTTAVANEIAKNNARSAAQTALDIANSRLY